MRHPGESDAGSLVQAQLNEQAALRRVATLVAEGKTPEELFAAVVNEAAQALDVTTVVLGRYESNTTVRILASLNEATFAAGSRWKLDGPSLAASVLDTGQPSRIDDYSGLPGAVAAGVRESRLRSTVGAPVVVNRAVWGVMTVGTGESEPLPGDTESRLGHFTELLAFAISNAETREQLRRLADEQASLRRVATLVAQHASTAEVLTAVLEEVSAVVGVPAAWLLRYGPGRSMTVLAVLNDPAFAVGTRWPLDGTNVTAAVFDTALPARIDDYSNLEGALAERTQESGFLSSVGVPIIVGGAVWGAICVGTKEVDPLPSDTESRLADFTDLAATAISNAEARSELIASRARLVAACDDARKRIERSLHDGTQQRLLAIGLDVQRIKASLSAEESDVRNGLERVGRDLELVLEGVRELSRGLHPQILARRGLRMTLVALARRSPIPVDLDIQIEERPPEQIETVVYYAVSEALMNAMKYSNASAISVKIVTDHPGGRLATGPPGLRGSLNLHVTITDDGGGGAAATQGSGLAGLVDRIDALGGCLSLESPLGGGTRLVIVLPLTSRAEP